MKTCKNCSAEFGITDEDLKFYDKISPIFGGKKYEIPPPTLCPDCRMQRRMTFRNERHLYYRTCDLSGKSIISYHHTNKGFPVYDHHEWWMDKWDGLEYGMDFDFSRTFFEQFLELQRMVPRISMTISHCENCDYAPYSVYSKNCYMCVSCVESEDIFFSYQTHYSRDSIDCSLVNNCELCYECIHSQNLFQCQFCGDCTNSRFLFFCKDCRGCSNCIGCKNLVNQKYCIFNKQVSEEEFSQTKSELEGYRNGRLMFEKAYTFFLTQPERSSHLINCESSFGDYLVGCQNSFACFDANGLEDCSYAYLVPGHSKDCQDINYTTKAELVYNSMSPVNNYHTKFALHSWDMQYSAYTDECFYSEYLFGCIDLKRKKYCILNKQYSKEEYKKLLPKIIEYMQKTGEWGEFFPVEISPFAYNETIAQEYFPMSKEEVLKKGWKWKDEEKFDDSGITKKIPAQKLPNSITDIPDDILNWAIICEESGKLFKIQKAELEFYRKMNLPIPHYHPDVRHAHRMALRNPRKLWTRNCAKCQKEIQTTYAPERPEIVYCEECYLKEVY
ncbi:hypothetical protein HZA38_05610 [Candidatus Peregrinibacteria bacterium]|nr:hypothetical protein [Candidatus Peregrinibacteria bacterium]